jgi:hypothetical protein
MCPCAPAPADSRCQDRFRPLAHTIDGGPGAAVAGRDAPVPGDRQHVSDLPSSAALWHQNGFTPPDAVA